LSNLCRHLHQENENHKLSLETKVKFSLDNRLTEIVRGWESRTRTLLQLIVACDGLKQKRSQFFFKNFENMKKLEGLALIHNDRIIVREEFKAKVALEAKFDSLTRFSNVKVKRLTNFVVDKVEHNSFCKDQLSILCGTQDELLAGKVKEEIPVAPLQKYIKN